MDVPSGRNGERMIDLHAHYLPGIDDGPATMDAALEMARLAVDDGIEAVTVTPHHLNGVYLNDAESIRRAVVALRTELERAGIGLAVYPGAEIHLTPELIDGLDDGTVMTVADRGAAVLVELPVHNLPRGADAILAACLQRGVRPVIAHPERCRPLQQDPRPLAQWVEMGCLVQITAQSCTGRFGHGACRAARRMIEAGLVHVLASDAHRPYGRVPCLRAGRAVVEQWAGEAAAASLTEHVPRMLLAGGQPEPAALASAAQRDGRAPDRVGWWRRCWRRG